MLFPFNDRSQYRPISRPSTLRQVLFSAVFFGFLTAFLGLQLETSDAQQVEGGSNSVFLPVITIPECFRYIEQNNLLVMEVEHAPVVDQWELETALAGFTGEGYYTWLGPNYFGSPGNAILTYPILITNAGEFNFRLHNRHDFPDPTEDNDVWARMDNGPWIKTFSPVAGQWTWGTFFDFGSSQTNASFLLSPGPHTLQISARSQDFSIDRIHFHKNIANENTALPVSPCS